MRTKERGETLSSSSCRKLSNALVQLQARYNHCDEVASLERCLLQRSLGASGGILRRRYVGALALRRREVVEDTEQVAVGISGGELVKTRRFRFGCRQ